MNQDSGVVEKHAGNAIWIWYELLPGLQHHTRQDVILSMAHHLGCKGIDIMPQAIVTDAACKRTLVGFATADEVGQLC